MSEFILAIFFFVGEQWVPHPEFMPLQYDTALECNERRNRSEEFFNSLEDFPVFSVECYQVTYDVPT